MLALVVGYGSIGARHARLLSDMGHEVTCVTGNPDCPFPIHESIDTAMAVSTPWLVIISTATVNHFENLESLRKAGYKGCILVEKPLFERVMECPGNCTNTFVAYNLRFHPLVTRARELLTGQKILNAQFHVGQYLPDWRPGTDYTKSYSANHTMGGGVLRDLSHELDLARFLLGPWQRVTAVGGRVSDLNITSDDQFSVLMTTAHCPGVSVHMDYLSRTPRRGFAITTPEHSLWTNFMDNTLTFDGQVEYFETDRDTTYRNQLEALAVEDPHLCSFDQGVEIVRLIEAIEQGAKERTWVEA